MSRTVVMPEGSPFALELDDRSPWAARARRALKDCDKQLIGSYGENLVSWFRSSPYH